MVISGCQAPTQRSESAQTSVPPAPQPSPSPSAPPPIRAVRCIYEFKPWLNLDKAGDADPEGIRYRVYLDPGTGRGVLRDGTFHVEMYRIQRTGSEGVKRTLVSDWHYPTSKINRIAKAGMLGEGYYLHLVWASKEIAGCEIEIITQFEDPEGRIARSGTKRLAVPKRPV